MQIKHLSIKDLVPQPAEFELSSFPGVKFKLKKWSLRVKAWAIEKYGAGELQKIMGEMKSVQCAEITFFMMEDESKKVFGNSVDSYMEGINSIPDEVAIHGALLKSMGIGEPEIAQLSKMIVEVSDLPDPKNQAPSDKSEN